MTNNNQALQNAAAEFIDDLSVNFENRTSQAYLYWMYQQNPDVIEVLEEEMSRLSSYEDVKELAIYVMELYGVVYREIYNPNGRNWVFKTEDGNMCLPTSAPKFNCVLDDGTTMYIMQARTVENEQVLLLFTFIKEELEDVEEIPFEGENPTIIYYQR